LTASTCNFCFCLESAWCTEPARRGIAEID
jgi:hypothetical protein